MPNMPHRQKAALAASNETSSRFGLVLSDADIDMLLAKHAQTLEDTGRFEPEGGILPRIAWHFCDSPYVGRHNWSETLYDLCESFYTFKKESHDAIDDEDLLQYMRKAFDTVCEGDIGALNDRTLEALWHGQPEPDATTMPEAEEDTVW